MKNVLLMIRNRILFIRNILLFMKNTLFLMNNILFLMNNRLFQINNRLFFMNNRSFFMKNRLFLMNNTVISAQKTLLFWKNKAKKNSFDSIVSMNRLKEPQKAWIVNQNGRLQTKEKTLWTQNRTERKENKEILSTKRAIVRLIFGELDRTGSLQGWAVQFPVDRLVKFL